VTEIFLSFFFLLFFCLLLLLLLPFCFALLPIYVFIVVFLCILLDIQLVLEVKYQGDFALELKTDLVSSFFFKVLSSLPIIDFAHFLGFF